MLNNSTWSLWADVGLLIGLVRAEVCQGTLQATLLGPTEADKPVSADNFEVIRLTWVKPETVEKVQVLDYVVTPQDLKAQTMSLLAARICSHWLLGKSKEKP